MSFPHADLELTVDLAVIADNWKFVKSRLSPNTECAAVLKADAYGLGMSQVAPVLAAAGCRTFFVATIDEGIKLRALLPEAEIFVLCGPHAGSESAFLSARLTPVLNEPGQIALWRECAPDKPAALHLDTSMSRLGLSANELTKLETFRPALILSHLACADTPDHPLNRQQQEAFQSLLTALPFKARASLAASSGIFLGPDYHYDLIRPGAALYGLAPHPGVNPMKNPIRLRARILQTRTIDTPGTVGYGATFRTVREQRLATVGLGYADGFPRSLSNRGHAFLAGVRIPIVGRVSMDLTVFDVTDVPQSACQPGAWIDILGPEQSPDTLAEQAQTIGYEILTSLSRRCRRVYLNEAAAISAE